MVTIGVTANISANKNHANINPRQLGRVIRTRTALFEQYVINKLVCATSTCAYTFSLHKISPSFSLYVWKVRWILPSRIFDHE